jgi:TonB family protein
MIGRLLYLVALSILSAVAVNAQVPSKAQVATLLRSIESDRRFVIECEKKAREERAADSAKPSPTRVSHCLSGDCPISIPKPWYPPAARQNRIRGEVIVDALVDEQGKVAYARLIRGPTIFRQSALTAAYYALHQPKQACGRRVKFWWQFRYNFTPE